MPAPDSRPAAHTKHVRPTVRAGLVGVTGYTGMELARLTLGHPHLDLVQVTSRSEAGRRLVELFPFLAGTTLADLTVSQPDPEALARECDIVFLAVPHGAAQEMAAGLLAAGARVVDLSADFRLRSPETFAHWYGGAHTQTELLKQAVYGLPELYADQIPQARLVANPGCYPTASILGLAPALKHSFVHTDDLVIDAKSGTSGAGRKAAVGSLFCEVHDSFRPYNLGKHRHTPEIEQELSRIAGQELTVSFSPHLLPIDRGILATIYTRLKPGIDPDQIRQVYADFYANHPLVRLLPHGTLPETRWVRGTMFCDIGLVHDPRTGRLLIVSAIDNLCRGASGQALANANLMAGLGLMDGLPVAPLMP